jgi:transposase
MPQYDIAQRAQALTMLLFGANWDQITDVTGICKRQVQYYFATAKARGFDPSISLILKNEYLEDAPRTGRPRALNEEQEEELVVSIRRDRYAREKTSLTLGVERSISASTVQRIFRRRGIHKLKPTCKPGLTAAMKAARLKFCQDHKDWTLEDWKNVIWTDETSVCLGHRRGSVRVWRTKQDRYDPTVVRPRWHSASEFMFWGCFTYDKKGLCHIWKLETAQEKKKAKAEIDQMNHELEPELRRNWELETGMRRMALRGVSRPKPQFRMTKENGAVVREKGKGGIDWWRYQQVILKPKLIPFALECMKDYPSTLV